MKTSIHKHGKSGAVSFLLVVTTGVVALLLTLYTYRQAVASHRVASYVQLSTDYSEKEDTVLRAIVALTPNRAINAMQNDGYSKRASLQWSRVFTDAIDLANARTSIASNVRSSLGLANLVVANSGDSTLSNPNLIFDKIPSDANSAYYSDYLSTGLNRSLGSSFPPPLQSGDSTVIQYDDDYVIISNQKKYGPLATGSVGLSVTEYPNFNLLKYPQINFGYARPGDDFVAKRNWWAFRMNLAQNDDSLTDASRMARTFVLSIYEVPSQLSISASSFMSLGEFANGQSWDRVTIGGGVFVGKADVRSTTLPSLASRRGMTLSSDSVIGGESFVSSPFAPGVREVYQLTQGDFFPVSLASESGRVAFVPISRGAEFFDRFSVSAEANTLSPTKWNDYSVGAQQCAMRLDIVDCVSSSNPTPTKLRFSYYKGGVRETLDIDLVNGSYSGLDPNYLYACIEGQSYDFGNSVVDLAYGKNGTYAYQIAQTGSVTFNNARFGDPLVGVEKRGYYKPSYPFEIKALATGKLCMAIYPERFERFLRAINADDTSINHSIVVNVDYTASTGSVKLVKPTIPCTDLDYGVILDECSDMTSFPKGFSLVTNLRTYIADDFNLAATTPPAGFTPSGLFYPPCSIFTPEKRYGSNIDPYAVKMSGQVGSLASDTNSSPVHPLDSTSASGQAYGSSNITVNLRPITHPAELPPITMMNWLITLEEVRAEFVSY